MTDQATVIKIQQYHRVRVAERTAVLEKHSATAKQRLEEVQAEIQGYQR